MRKFIISLTARLTAEDAVSILEPLGPSTELRDSAAIDITSVIDVQDVDLLTVFIDRVADPVFPAPRTPMPFERGSQRCANSVWFLG